MKTKYETQFSILSPVYNHFMYQRTIVLLPRGEPNNSRLVRNYYEKFLAIVVAEFTVFDVSIIAGDRRCKSDVMCMQCGESRIIS